MSHSAQSKVRVGNLLGKKNCMHANCIISKVHVSSNCATESRKLCNICEPGSQNQS